jgi:dsDNA-specific endonuclease/ATPase MutS2
LALSWCTFRSEVSRTQSDFSLMRASLALSKLRRDIERQRKLVQESLERFLRTHREEGVLQEEFVTIRNERFVVPVIAGRQRKRLDSAQHLESHRRQQRCDPR